MKPSRSISVILYLLPALTVAWTLFLRIRTGPFYMSSIDPEYMYLISGLNCGTLNFKLIGHIDHPGTPLQLLSGLFFRMIHLLYGHQDFRTDVISDPELYLTLSSVMLAALTFGLLLRLGQLAFRYTSSLLGALVLQAASFYTLVNAGILARYSPDRLMPVIILLFFLVYLKYRFDPEYGPGKFALWSGVVMGAGLMTKFNFAPLLLIPVFLVPGRKHRRNYLLATMASAFLLFLPVSSKYRSFLKTTAEMITHKGLYGTGEKGVVDLPRMMDHIVQIFSSHPSFTILVLLGMITTGIWIIKPGRTGRNREEYRFLAASIVAIAAGLVITAKHYKGYYALPFLSLIPMMLFSLIRILEEIPQIRKPQLVSAGLFALLLSFPLVSVARQYAAPNQDLIRKRIAHTFIKSEIGPDDFMLITPSWKSTPMQENAMVLGVSYFHHRWRYAMEFCSVYPRVLTWEGADTPFKCMRMKDVRLEEVLMSGAGIYLYAQPGLNIPEVCSDLEQLAAEAGIGIVRDTLYASAPGEELLIRYRNSDGWKQLKRVSCGFEKLDPGGLLTDNGLERVTGKFTRTDRFRAIGTYSVMLDESLRTGPAIPLNDLQKGDFVSLAVKVHTEEGAYAEEVTIHPWDQGSGEGPELLHPLSSHVLIDKNWVLVSLFGEIARSPSDGRSGFEVRFSGSGKVYLDDFTLTQYRQVP